MGGGYYLAYSGGKDSDVIKILAELAGVKHENVYNLTTVDAPETVNYIKNQPDVRINRNHYSDGKPITMWNLIVKHGMPPLRIMRYCCRYLKESGGRGRVVVTGVRWAESVSRKEHSGIVNLQGKPKTTVKDAENIGVDYRVTKQGGVVLNDDNDLSRKMVEHCYRTRKTSVNPIVDWTDDDVWNFLHHYGCDGNPLYQCGFKRIGCIGCPMQRRGLRTKEFERYPKYRQLYINAFNRMLERRKEKGLKTNENWSDGQAVFDWWIDT